MWCLEEHEGRYIYILPGSKISFGKSQANIKIEGDATISRLHAIVSLEPDEESELQCKCVIYDLSKYGTYILRDEQKQRLLKGEKFVLKSDDKVQFGQKCSIFTVTHRSFVVATSSLKQENIIKVKNIIKDLGGILSTNWNTSCTYLTVPNRSVLTIKLTCALASARTIVTIAYWEAVMKAVKETNELPKIENFLPDVNEEWLHGGAKQLLPKEQRKTLFQGLLFVYFCPKQYTSYNSIITAAGGKSCLYPTKKPLTPRSLMARNVIVVQQPTNDSSQFTAQIIADYPTIHHSLSSVKRRMISDSEIPLAILYCSIEKYCNPKFNFGTFLKSSSQTSFSSDVVIVEDTQNVPSASNKEKSESKERRIIPETLDSQHDSSTSERIRRCPENKERNIPENIKSANDVSIFPMKNTKEPRIIPETCDSFDKSIANISFPRNSTEQARVIPESCDKSSLGAENERSMKNILQEDIEIEQQKEVTLEKTNNSILKNFFEEDDFLLEDNDTTLKKHNLTLRRKNVTSEKRGALEIDNSSQNDEGESESWKNSKRPRIVSIEMISKSNKDNVCTDRMMGRALEKDRPRIEETPDIQLKQRDKEKQRNEEIEVIDVNKKDKRQEEKSRKMGVKEVRIEKRNQNKQKPRKMGTEWYDKYLGCEFSDLILRKDAAPCGNRFVKASVPASTRKLGSDDFVLEQET